MFIYLLAAVLAQPTAPYIKLTTDPWDMANGGCITVPPGYVTNFEYTPVLAPCETLDSSQMFILPVVD